MIWSPALGDVFGLLPWDVADLTPREVERIQIYLEKLSETPRVPGT